MSGPTLRRADADDEVTIDGLVGDAMSAPRVDGPIGHLLDAAAPAPSADHGTVWSGDGLFRASIPLENLRHARLEQGRLQVPDAPNNCWNVKDVVRIELTDGKRPYSIDLTDS